MRKIIHWTIIFSVAFGALYAFEMTRLPCRQALQYAIGSFDQRFGISQTEFKLLLVEAEKPWEESIGRDLFQYSESALFPVNLIYDERQERTVEGQKLDEALTQVEKQQETLKEKYDALVLALNQKRKEYNGMLADFEERLRRYNKKVTEWNNSDRSDEDDYVWLKKEEKELKRDQEEIEEKRKMVNTLVVQVNSYAQQEEKVIEKYNTQVQDFTETYGPSEPFDQGEYVGKGINIYQFEDRDHLRMVLVHELGHALGIGHVENPVSIMYPMMQAQDVKNLRLSHEDKVALMAVCSVSTFDLLKRDLRSFFELVRGKIGQLEK